MLVGGCIISFQDNENFLKLLSGLCNCMNILKTLTTMYFKSENCMICELHLSGAIIITLKMKIKVASLWTL